MRHRRVWGALLRAWVPLVLCGSAGAQQTVDVTWVTFAQLTAEHANGADGVGFGRDRVRAKAEVTSGPITGGGVLDFGVRNLSDEAPGTFAYVVADLYVNYRVGADHVLRVGQFKTPFGMDFNVPGHQLDLTKRGLEAGLLFDRDVGVMVNGQSGSSGFGYDFGVFNPPGRSRAVNYLASQVGDDNAVIGRLRYDLAQWHAELAYGEATAAGGPGTETYRATDAGVRYTAAKWNAKAEWLEGRGVHGDPSRTESVYYVHGAYSLSDRVEFVARHYAGRSDVAGVGTRLTNDYVGATLHLFNTARMNGRFQANYVFAGEHEDRYSGVSGYRDDTLLVQFQIYAEE